MGTPTDDAVSPEQTVAALLAAAGLNPSAAERSAMAASFATSRALADLLHAVSETVPEARYAEPAPTWSAVT
jgi:hypothetical protein